jgi:hypothetical protein
LAALAAFAYAPGALGYTLTRATIATFMENAFAFGYAAGDSTAAATFTRATDATYTARSVT